MTANWKAKLVGLSRKATWPLAYSLAPRILVGLKFLVLARLLGPEEFGHYVMAFLWLTVMEGLSDFGFRQAIVQSHDELNHHQLAQINTVQLVRGLGLIPLVAGVAWLARGYLNESFHAVLLVSLVPLARGLYGTSLAMAQRRMAFKSLAGFDLSWRSIDLLLGVAAGLIWQSSFAVVVASVVGEFCGFVISFAWLRMRMNFAKPTTEISSLVKYGRWIWGQTILTLLLNQFDKFYVAGVAGERMMGGYQAINRTMQMLFADPVLMLTGILFPKLSEKVRNDPAAAEAFNQKLLQHGALLLSTAFLAVVGLRDWFIRLFLGAQWMEFSYLVPVFASTMLLGALIAYLVTWYRSVGRPQVVTLATVLQIIVYAPTVIWWGKADGAIGVALANNVSLWITVLTMLLAFPSRIGMLMSLGIFTLLPVGAFSALSLQWPELCVPGMCIFVALGWFRCLMAYHRTKSLKGAAA